MLCVIDREVLMCYVLALLMMHVEGGPLQLCSCHFRLARARWDLGLGRVRFRIVRIWPRPQIFSA